MQNSGKEFEIKLLFPKEKLPSINQFIIDRGGLKRQRLQASYIDTQDFLLANSGVALRLRKEGRKWIQTLKAPTLNSLERLEHNIEIQDSSKGVPPWSLYHHGEHPAGKALIKLLSKLPHDSLNIRYSTDIWRRKALIKTRTGQIEYSLDVGLIKAINSNGQETTLSIQELEIELIQGHHDDVLNHAKNFIKRYKAIIDTKSKSELGYLLANELQATPPTKSKITQLNNQKSDTEIIQSLVNSCLAQILPNLSVLNNETSEYEEYLHQLRIGLRRLKTALKYIALKKIYISESGMNALSSLFQKLGEYRDNEYLKEKLNPSLKASQGPQVNLLNQNQLPHPKNLISNLEFQLLMVELISLGHKERIEPKEEISNLSDPISLKKATTKLMDRKNISIKDDVQNFHLLSEENIHKLRKKMKFLRYSLEFFNAYCNPKRYTEYFKSINLALNYLGNYNDISVAIEKIAPKIYENPQMWFALGWLRSEQTQTKKLALKSLKQFTQLKKIW